MGHGPFQILQPSTYNHYDCIGNNHYKDHDYVNYENHNNYNYDNSNLGNNYFNRSSEWPSAS